MSSGAFWAEWDWQDDLLPYSGASAASYPAITPVRRRYNLGTFSVSRESNFSGGYVKFLHSDFSSSLLMTLEYESLQQPEIAAIRDHYRGQDGSMIPFLLPDEIWAGHSSTSNLVPAGTRWRYQRAPSEQQNSAGYVSASIELITADNWLPSPEPLDGFDLAVSVIWSPGAATQTGPMSLAVVVSWSPGAATATGADVDDGFAGSLFWSEDLFTSWR